MSAEDHAKAAPQQTDLLTFASSWLFWSITTALGIAGHLVAAKVATASGAWAEIVDLYRRTVHGIFGGLPGWIAQHVDLPIPHLTSVDASLFGLVLIMLAPAITFALWRLRLRDPNFYSRTVIFLLVAALLFVWWFNAYVVDRQVLGLSSLLSVFLVPAFMMLAGWILDGMAGLLFYVRNLIGAVVILAGLALTGFFSVTSVTI